MKSSQKQAVFTVLGIILSSNSFADNNVDVITTVSVAALNMQLDIFETYVATVGGTFGGNTREISINPKMSATEVSVTILNDNFYYGFSTMATGQSVARYNLITFDKQGNSVTATNSQEVTSKTSNNIFVGYSIKDNISLYGGLTYGTGNYGDEIFIDELGPFIGGRYALQLTVVSSINFDFSFSTINTETTFKDTGFNPYTIKATDTALSYSATWLRALNRGRSFFVRLKIASLSLRGDGVVEEIGGKKGTATLKGTQILTSLNLGMGF